MEKNWKEEGLTGYPSIDKPWLSQYPCDLIALRNNMQKHKRIMDKLKIVWNNLDDVIINYYDTDIKARDFFHRVNKVAKSLVALGIKKGDSIVASLESVPEYIELLLASELIGCCIKDFLGSIEEIVSLINSDETTSYYFAPDYLTSLDAAEIYAKTTIKNIITIDPLFSVENKNKLRGNIAEVINSKYSDDKTTDTRNISWNEFLTKSEGIAHFKENNDNSIRLFSSFTSGSTGESKEVMHSSESTLGIVNQLTLFSFHEKCKDTWLLTILPPTLVAVVVAMMCYPLADGKKLILDPYCKMEDIDIEMMHYEPNCWAVIPIFFEVLINSKRIPNDYDMSYFKLFGFGAESITMKFINKVQNFLNLHNCKAPFSCGYGQSEGGSDFTVAMGTEMLLSGSSGIPLIDTVISIFEPNTTNELKYYEIGEICKAGPGIMIGYSDKKLTDEVLKIHPDGNLWLHTGDTGYMTEEGLLFVLGRGGIKVYPNKLIFPLEIENKITSINGVKDAVVVAGKDSQNITFEVPYLFVIPEKDVLIDELLIKINSLIDAELSPQQKPKEVFVIDKKPISKFKVDRKGLQKQYNLI